MKLQQELFGQVQQIASDVFQVSPESITRHSAPNETKGWDSLGHVNLVVALEEAFGVQFTAEEVEQMLSVELIELIIRDKLER